MSYAVKEIFYSLQGEGAQTGRAAVFCRFAGCNLWSGREADRAAAICRFCDTDFVGVDGPNGGHYESTALVDRITSAWPGHRRNGRPLVIFTGGEPLLQLDEALLAPLHAAGFQIAIETNGTKPVPAGVDWVCVSPKSGADLVLQSGDELKLVYPQHGLDPSAFEHMRFSHFFLQPMYGPDVARHTTLALAYCLGHPLWRLSIQTQKVLNIP